MTEPGHSAAAVAELLGWPVSRVYGWVRDGLVEPRSRRPMTFAFRDLVVLRAVDELLQQGIPARRLKTSLRQLRSRLPDGRPLSTVALRAAGPRVLVRDGDLWVEPASGQTELPLDAPPSGTVTPVPARESVLPAPQADSEADDRAADPEADQLYDQALALEDDDPGAAMRLYRRAIALDDRHGDAHINLGRLLQADGDAAGAERCYRAALEREGDPALAWFNLGTALEELGRIEDAIACYESSCDTLPDAHYNLARLYEKRGDRTRAIAHLRALKILCH